MTKKEFKKWTKNGNFTISQERILEVTNHIAEGYHKCYTKKEAAECVTYWALKCSDKVNDTLSKYNEKLIKQLDVIIEGLKNK